MRLFLFIQMCDKNEKYQWSSSNRHPWSFSFLRVLLYNGQLSFSNSSHNFRVLCGSSPVLLLMLHSKKIKSSRSCYLPPCRAFEEMNTFLELSDGILNQRTQTFMASKAIEVIVSKTTRERRTRISRLIFVTL